MIKVYTDGACRVSNPGLCSSAFVVYKDGKLVHKQGRVLDGLQTNNIAEYNAVIYALVWLEKNNVRNAILHCDSKLVVHQVNQNWKCHGTLKPYMSTAYGLLVRGAHILKHIKGHDGEEGNEQADSLCNELLDQYQKENNVKSEIVVSVVEA